MSKSEEGRESFEREVSILCHDGVFYALFETVDFSAKVGEMIHYDWFGEIAPFEIKRIISTLTPPLREGRDMTITGNKFHMHCCDVIVCHDTYSLPSGMHAAILLHKQFDTVITRLFSNFRDALYPTGFANYVTKEEWDEKMKLES